MNNEDMKPYSERLKKFSKAVSELTYAEMMEFAWQIYVRVPTEIDSVDGKLEAVFDPHAVAEAIIGTAHHINPINI